VEQPKSDPSCKTPRWRTALGWAFGKGWLQITLRTIALVIAFVTAVIVGVEHQRQELTKELNQDFNAIVEFRDNWQPVFLGMARAANGEDKKIPSQAAVKSMLTDIDNALSRMAAFDAPTRGIKRARRSYIDALERLSGSVFSYSEVIEPGLEDYRSLHNTMQAEANDFGFLAGKVDAFRGNRLRAVWGTIF